MKTIDLDIGEEAYQMPGGILRIYPKDPNLYQRFMEAGPQILTLEKELTDGAEALEKENGGEPPADAVLRLLAQADRKVKAVLNKVFGGGNDFDALLLGVNVMAVAGNGERVVTNLLNALQPILREGAEKCAQAQAEDAVKEAAAARARREALAAPGA